ncbi:MAG: ABC transporter permease [Planctomycetes bacterium]|nr:ABC transporter permease [Planctomycetota bacterium]
MGFASRLARRNLRQRLGRTLFSVLGITVGIATVIGVFTLDHNTVEGMKVRVSGEWRPDLEVRAGEEVGDPKAVLAETEGVARSVATFENEAMARVEGREAPKPVRIRVFAIEASALPELDAYGLLEGADLDRAAERPEALIGSTLANALKLGVGDTLYLARPQRAALKDCVDGELTVVERAKREAPTEYGFRVAGILKPERLGRRSNGQMALVDFGWGRKLYGDARVDARYWVTPDETHDLTGLQTRLAANFAYDASRKTVVGAQADEVAFRNGVRLAGLLALVLGLYVIFHTLSMSLVERIREVGVLHALGTTRGQIARVFLVEALFLAGLGGAFGIAGGLLLAKVLLHYGITTLGTGHHFPNFTVPWGVVLGLAALGVGIALLGSVFPLMRAGKADTVEALRGEESLASTKHQRGFHMFAALLLAVLLPALYLVIVPVVGPASGPLVGAILLAVGVLAVMVVVPLVLPSLVVGVCRRITQPLIRVWPFSGRMAGRAMEQGPRRVAVSTAAIAMVIAAFVGLKAMTNSLRAETEVWAEAAMGDKLYLRNLPETSFEGLRALLHEHPSVLGVESASVRHYAPFLLLGEPTEELLAYGPLSRDPQLRQAFESERGIILSERVAKNLDYVVGDRVRVGAGGAKVVEFQVIAISDEYGYFPNPDERMYGVVADHYMKQFFCLELDRPEMIAIRTKRGADFDELTELVRGHLPENGGDMNALNGNTLPQIYLHDIDTDFMLFDLILFLTGVLATLGVLNAQLLASMERAAEIGILRAIGATPRQVTGAVWIEALVIGTLGGLFGLALGALLGPVIRSTLENLSGLVLPHRGPGWWAWLALAAALVAPFVASLYPARRARSTDLVRAVRGGA